MTTTEAAERLGVKPETLYAYVSRGLIEPRRVPGGVSTFAARDVERLARSGRRSRALPPLVFPSALTRIADGRVTYRGLDAVEAASTHTFEQVAEWLWIGDWQERPSWPVDLVALDRAVAAQQPMPTESLPIDRFRVIAAVVGAEHGTGRQADVLTDARRLIRLMAHGLPRADRRAARRAEPARSVAEVLWTRLTRLPRNPHRVAVLDLALGLLADHELASSTLAARLAAMVRARVPDVVGAGLNVLAGVRHGGASVPIEALLRDAVRVGAEDALTDRLGPPRDNGSAAAPRRVARSGEAAGIEGFGHELYPRGDPRAVALIDRLEDLDAPGDRLAVVRGVLAVAAHRGLPPPTVDLALAAVAFCADMPPGSGEAVFALARAAGWIAHAIEQYGQPTFMRARVDYIGPDG
ncbi:MAG: helix-turn-helix domain-containing protein [Acidimicrobiales bacterium]|nr:helix-turn-helix domain-containing protein [Acidimicrobiales bacterium]